MTFGTRNKGRGWRVDPASVTHPDFQRALERIRRYLGADPAAVVAAGIRRGWCAYPQPHGAEAHRPCPGQRPG
ncbi:MAG: hypothetical protein N2378_12320 [Chloroflexaceae bacterium]|nr:hypothetical protein [Chloroflexaceae bacterium]